VTITVGDGGVWQPIEPVDAVLLDAPCSATGTLRRHPDVMHLKGNKDVNQLMGLQSRLLDNASAMVKSGGMLIYCTCSLQKSEGELQVDVFLANHPEFQRQPISADEVGGVETIISDTGDLRILPYHLAPYGGMDGFYVNRLVKD
jgi:16S rRNA (cytosine967-C5)-methyltransferase